MKRQCLMLVLVVTSVGCGGEKSSDPGPKAGIVTLEFSNPTSADVFIDSTSGWSYAIERAGKPYSTGFDCTPTCGTACDCYVCGAPLPTVRRILPGASLVATWAGEYFELESSCSGQCQCQREKAAAFGDYTVTLLGARGRSPSDGPPAGSTPDTFQGDLDNSAGDCTASTSFALDASDRKVTVPFACTQ